MISFAKEFSKVRGRIENTLPPNNNLRGVPFHNISITSITNVKILEIPSVTRRICSKYGAEISFFYVISVE